MAAARRRKRQPADARTPRPHSATGYYRPEDIDLDPVALAAGNVRFCGNNTGDERKTTSTARPSASPTARSRRPRRTRRPPRSSRSSSGTSEINMPDNIAFQPGRGNWLIHEDGEDRVRESRTTTTSGTACPTGRTGPAVRRLRPDRHAERPDRGVDRRHLRRLREALLRQHPAQHQRQGHDPRHHRLGSKGQGN